MIVHRLLILHLIRITKNSLLVIIKLVEKAYSLINNNSSIQTKIKNQYKRNNKVFQVLNYFYQKKNEILYQNLIKLKMNNNTKQQLFSVIKVYLKQKKNYSFECNKQTKLLKQKHHLLIVLKNQADFNHCSKENQSSILHWIFSRRQLQHKRENNI